jgi:hypothetical protein
MQPRNDVPVVWPPAVSVAMIGSPRLRSSG